MWWVIAPRRLRRGAVRGCLSTLAFGGGATATCSLLLRGGCVVRLEEPPKPAPKRSLGSAEPSKRVGSVNVDQEMLKLRRIFLTGDINDDTARLFVQQLLYLEADDPHAPVTIFINSGGGLVHSGLAILDVMSHVSTPLHTVAYGRCFSIAALLLSAGTRGHRSAFSHARLMIHEPSCSYPKLQCSDIMIKVDELRHTQQILVQVLSVQTGRPREEISQAVARDRYMSVTEAIDFGIIDIVMPSGLPALPQTPRPREVPSGPGTKAELVADIPGTDEADFATQAQFETPAEPTRL